uniref:Secreted protein n=1 Tax=Oryzias melastigma TaxID=30732 RepID=A0A3B3CJ72_ORYME
MCTTMMVLTTIALILRQRFSNKIQPYACSKKERTLQPRAQAEQQAWQKVPVPKLHIRAYLSL